jgi:hypothetical protein
MQTRSNPWFNERRSFPFSGANDIVPQSADLNLLVSSSLVLIEGAKRSSRTVAGKLTWDER